MEKEENIVEEKIVEETVEEIKTDEAIDKTDDGQTIEADNAEETDLVSDESTKLTELEASYSDLEDRFLRVQAEMANMKRIHQREKQDSAKYRSQKLATELLEVVDNLERALSVETTTEEAASVKKGVELVLSQFKTAFEKESIEIIDPLNETFDPNYHQAVSMMPASEGQASDTVINVLQKGYKLNDRVLRPAMVIVAK